METATAAVGRASAALRGLVPPAIGDYARAHLLPSPGDAGSDTRALPTAAVATAAFVAGLVVAKSSSGSFSSSSSSGSAPAFPSWFESQGTRPPAVGYQSALETQIRVDADFHAGELAGPVFAAHGIKFVFCLAGGHIAPLLSGCERVKPTPIRVIDVRHEATAVFAADSVSRTTGTVGVAIVTAGPGVANTICALKNAQMAQSPILLIGGATSDLLRGRGSLQDIDQKALVSPHVKHFEHVASASHIVPALERALRIAQSGVPGPVFLEFPADVLYSQTGAAKEFAKFRYTGSSDDSVLSKRALIGRATNFVFDRHIRNTFDLTDGPSGSGWWPTGGSASLKNSSSESNDNDGKYHTTDVTIRTPKSVVGDKYAYPELWQFLQVPRASDSDVQAAARSLLSAKRPVVMVGSQTMLEFARARDLAQALERIGAATFLSGSARGLLGSSSAVQYCHQRSDAMKVADVVLLAGVTNDFRMGYGRTIAARAHLISANRSKADLYLNRTPQQAVLAESADFVIRVAAALDGMRGASLKSPHYADWHAVRRAKEDEHNAGLSAKRDAHAFRTQTLEEKRATAAATATSPAPAREELVNPVVMAYELENVVPDNAIFVADGGDIVGTAAYVLRGRGPHTWLDPGAFGTLGVGFGFALGAALACPDREVWCIFGDGAVGFSLVEIDTLVRHGVRVIAVVGNDGCWTQIHRDQVNFLESDAACMLTQAPYERSAEALGGLGIAVGGQFSGAPSLDDNAAASSDNNSAQAVNRTLMAARKMYAESNKPVLVNVHIGKSDFREGSMSM